MSDFRVQYIAGTVPDGVTQHALTAPTDFTQLGALSSAFILPATSMQTVGLGIAGGSSQMRDWALNCDINSTSQILLNRGNGNGACEFAFYIIEYIGLPGGVNEFIMRAKRIIEFGSGSLTAAGNPVSAIADITRCVPFISGRHSDTGTAALRHFLAEARVYNSAGDDLIGLTRLLTTNGEPTYVCYCVEFTGTAWSVQTGTESNWTASTNKDTAITPLASILKSWVYGHFLPGNRDTPAGQTWYAWLPSLSVLRTRTIEVSGLSTLRFWIIQNSSAGFGRQAINVVDGVDDWAAGSSPQAFVVPISQTFTNGVAITGWAGSSATSTADNPASVWRLRQYSPTEAQAYRTRALGGSEYIIQVLSFPVDSDATVTLQPAPAILGLSTGAVNGPLVIVPGAGLMLVSQLGPFSEVTRSPAAALLSLQGRSVIAIAVNPGVAIVNLNSPALFLGLTKILQIPMPALDYVEKINAPPTVIIGTVLAPVTAALQIQALQHAATEGGDITTRSPAAALLSLTGQPSALGTETAAPVHLTVVGQAPTLVFSETLIEPGVGLLNAPGFEARQVRIFIPHQWIDVEPAPVVPWT